MNMLRSNRSSSRFTALARGVAVALTGSLLAVAPVASAHAAQGSEGLASDDAPLTMLGQRLAARRDDASAYLRQVVRDAVDRSAHRADEVGDKVELVITFGHGFEGLLQLDASAFEPALEPAVDDRAATGRARRLDYVENTQDPLAGL